MKVLQTIKYYEPSKGGMESVAKNLVDGLIKTNPDAQFIVYCNNHQNSLSSERHVYSAQLTVVREATPILLKSQPLNYFYRNLKKLLTDTDVVHHHYPFPTMELALSRQLPLLKTKKFIITWHANIENSRWSSIGKLYNPLTHKLLSAADAIIVTSPQLFEQSKILREYEDKVKVIPLTFDSQFASNTARSLPHSQKKILFVGKLRDYKGVRFLIEAMKGVDALVDIVGNGEKEKELRTLVSDLDLGTRISFHTQVSDDQLKNFYRDADLFVLPSINEAEAFGVVQLEAMSAGLPVINTYLNSGVPFVSLDKVTGRTVSPGEVEELRTAILEILSDAELYHRYSCNALARAAEFTVDKMVNKYFETYI